VASLPSPALPAAVSTDKVEPPSAPPATTATLSPSAPAADTALAAEVPSSAPTVATVAAAPAPADAASDGIIVFTAKAPSWVQVTDAKGNAVLRKILAPAEVARVSGALPLTVVVGRADATSVQVKGKPFNLASSTKNNVARFEVK
jgi:cytoskeleton protein RodZ